MKNASTQLIAPRDLWQRLSEDQGCQIIDVREPDEYQSERISGSLLIPLSQLENKSGQIDREKPAYILCRSGNRARRAADQLANLGVKHTLVIEGGLKAWEQAGYPVERASGGVWSMERQVRCTAGLLVLIGVALAYTLNANWILLSTIVALGMIFSAITNSCGMATLLMRMPWNQGSCTSICQNTPDRKDQIGAD